MTHPNDLYAGEVAEFRFTVDGMPAEGLEISLIREGIRYRDQPGQQTVRTDAEGLVRIDWPEPGKYWLETVAETESRTPGVQSRRLSYSATLEVLPL